MILQGVDSNSIVRPLLVDGSGRAMVVPASPSALLPSPVIAKYTLNLVAAGYQAHTVYTVPAAQVVIIDYVAVYYQGTVAGLTIRPNFGRGGVTYFLGDFINLATAVSYAKQVRFVAEAADTVVFELSAGTVGDLFVAVVLGERIQ